jgi:hypothetical protein
MDPNRPRTHEELALEAEANRQPAERPAVEGTTAPPTEAAAEVVDAGNAGIEDLDTGAGAAPGALDPAAMFGSFDVGVRATPDAVPDSIVERRSSESIADTALSPPPIEEIVASLPAAPIADVPAATMARDVFATWEDLPADFDSHHDDATADHRGWTNDGVRGVDPQPVPASLDIGSFMATDPIEPPSGANEDFDTSDRTPRANPTDYIAAGNFLGPSNDPTVIERGPLRTDDDSWRPKITLLSETGGKSDVPERSPDAELSPRATMLQSPTSDGGPPLARPILMASVPDEDTRRLLDEALAEAGRRDAKTAAEIAQKQVDDVFWLRACEERALYRGR